MLTGVLLATAVLAPVLLMVLLLAMERVERPFHRRVDAEDVEAFLETASPADVDDLVSDGLEVAAERRLHRRRGTDRPADAA